MGYTHYWKVRGYLPVNQWHHLLTDARILTGHVRMGDVPIRGPLGAGEPWFTTAGIHLNGCAATGDDFESFDLEREVDNHPYRFCKTDHRDYDLLVTAILARAEHLLGEDLFLAASDALDVDQWEPAVRLLERVWPHAGMPGQVHRIVHRPLMDLVNAGARTA